ncbi:MAG: hypothetical protein V4764_12035 [Burkholderia sp.]
MELARLRAAALANLEDARIWRWYADLMEEERVCCTHTRGGWRVTVDGQYSVEDESFDRAVRLAARQWFDMPTLSVALRRRRKRSAGPAAAPLPRIL